TFVNNIFQISGSATAGYVFEEETSTIDPIVLLNNDFNFGGLAISVKPPYYLDEGTNTLTDLTSVNMLSGASANVNLMPSFIAGSFPHVSGASGVRNAGTSMMGGPIDDYDGQARPQGGNAPDIGADEVP